MTSVKARQNQKIFLLWLTISVCTSLLCQFSAAQITSPEKKAARAPVATPQIEAIADLHIFGMEDGLTLSSIHFGFVDSRGYVWFGTNGRGVSRYDGQGFTNYTTETGLAHNMVPAMLEDNKGNLWFGTFGGGVSKFDGNSFRTISVKDGLAHDMVISMLKDRKDNLWFGTFEGGVSKFDGKKFTTLNQAHGLKNNKVWSMAEDSDGNIIFGTDNGVSILNGNTFTEIKQLSGKSVHSILVDSHGNTWFATDGQGVVRKSGDAFTSFTIRDGLADNSIWCITEDRNGIVWLGTQNGGVSSFNGSTFTTITKEQGLPHSSVRSITEDKNGSLWFGTYGGGVVRLNGKAFSTFTTEQGLPSNKVRSILQDDKGNLWFGTLGGGISKYDGKQFFRYTTAQGLPSDQVRTLLIDRGKNIWIGTHGAGVAKFDGKSFSTLSVKQGLVHNNIRCMLQDQEGAMWFGTDKGVSKYDGRSIVNYTTRDGLINDCVWSMLQDSKGRIWFGTFGGGVITYDGNKFVNYTTADGLAHNSIVTLHEDTNGTIWIGTAGGGLSRYDGKTFKTIDNIPDETVYDILEDPLGNLWIGTNLGISLLQFESDQKLSPSGKLHVSNNELETKFTPVWTQYNYETGYPVKDINTNAMFMTARALPFRPDEKGVIWAACGDDKTIRFDPAFLRKKETIVNLVISKVSINDENISWHSLYQKSDSTMTAQQEIQTYGRALLVNERDTLREKFGKLSFDSISPFSKIPEGLSLSSQHDRISFDFAAIETARYFRVLYQYMLEGQDENWSPSTKSTTATFSNLWEGNYTFKVRAQNADGVWGEPLSFSFVVNPPWWRMSWMYFVYAISFCFCIYGLIKLRERKLVDEKLHLESIVANRTSEVVEQRNRAEEQRHEAEKQKKLVEEMNEHIKEQLDHATHDLSTQTLHMIHRHNTFQELETELRKMASNGESQKFQKMLTLISVSKSLDKEWERFDYYFNTVHKDFAQKLTKHSIQLSNYEQRICALIRTGMENREIAALLNIEVGSVKVAKYRIKKKLNMDESDDLFAFISSL